MYLVLICFVIALTAKAQDKSYTESDFYGTWSLDLNEYELENDLYIFEKEKSSSSQEEKLNIIVTFLESSKCRVNYDRTSGFCGNETFKEYNWSFDKGSDIINIYHSIELLKEFKEQSPEDFKDFDLPEKYKSMELKIVTLQNGGTGLEISDWE
ncbi:hypothetical protein CLV90_1996 [Maribacter spongiicola]|uniref:Lipocalin-like protein n=2 Tax=Maribacter spongiicola TaxID=1206753 RepID=A0A4R7K475_9FLAO|nr:hypothetical protein CLV90_1996 [Maribacter spongiicola]